MKPNQFSLLASGLAGMVLFGTAAQAGPFTYNPNDLLLGFRSASSSYDFVVDLGPISSFYIQNQSQVNVTTPITAYNPAQLAAVFGGLDGLSFSTFADVRTTSNPN